MATATVEGSFAQTGPATPVVESARVDEVMPRAKMATRVRMILAIIVAIIMLIPVYWMATTAIKSRPDAVAAPPKLIFAPSLDGFIGLFFDRSQSHRLSWRPTSSAPTSASSSSKPWCAG
jgi:ABC-type glycerol-3-phosphate transport system permease component